MHLSRDIFLRPAAILAALLFAAGLSAQPKPGPAPATRATEDDESSPSVLRLDSAQVVLSYHETVKKDKELVEEHGGIVNAVKNVGHQMDAMGDSKDASARLELTLTPQLTRSTTPGQPSVVTLVTHQESWTIDPNMSPKSTGQLASDVAAVMKQLNAWKRVLTPEQLAQLDRGESLEFNVRTPLAVPVLLSHTNAAVAITQVPRPSVVAINVTSMRGGRLTVGAPAIVEVKWDRPYRHPTCAVKLSAGGRELALAAKNTGDNVTFRSLPFLPYSAENDDGLAPPGEDSGHSPSDDSTATPPAPDGTDPVAPGIIPDRPVKGARPVAETNGEVPHLPGPEDNAIYRIGSQPVSPTFDPAKDTKLLSDQPPPAPPPPPKKTPR